MDGADGSGDISRLKILFLVRELATGTQTYTQSIIQELRRRGVEIAVGYTGDKPDLPCELFKLDSSIPPTLDRKYLVQLFRFLWVGPALKDCVRRFRPQIVFGQGLDEIGFTTIFWSRVFGCLPVTFVHDLTLEELRFGSRGGRLQGTSVLYGFSLLRQRLASRRMRRILVASNFMRDSLSSMFGVSVTVTGLGVDDRFREVQSRRAERPFRLLFVGNLTWKKRPEVPLIAISKIKMQDVNLIFVGEGPRKRVLMKMRDELGLGARVDFLERIPLQQLLEVLSRSHASVAPSLWEGFGLSAAESLAAGVPVLASDSGGLREIVVDGRNGFLVPLNAESQWVEEIERLAGDRALLAALAKEARVSSVAFAWADVGKRTIAAITG